jgi:SAM-dependent methyltransferase
MRFSHPVRALGRSLVGLLPRPLGDALRQAKREIINARGAAAVFRGIYKENGWDGTESVSGPGSSMAATAHVRAALPGLLNDLGVKSLLDVPCGDAFWIGACLPSDVAYTGGDVVPELIAYNRRNRPEFGVFSVLNLATDPLPPADLILVRDCFIHLPNRMIIEALANIRRADIRYLLTTTFPGVPENIEIELGGFRPVNLTLRPIGLPEPDCLLIDEDEAGKSGKHLGLWNLRR